MSSLVSLGIAFTGLLLSIFAFMLKDASRAVRYGVGVFFYWKHPAGQWRSAT